MTARTILTVDGLSKDFGSSHVLNGVDFSVQENSIVGFVGRNGAGKTTTIKIALGLIPATSGSVTICGKPVVFGQAVSAQDVGYLPDVPEFYDYMTPKEYLKMSARLSGLEHDEIASRIQELLEKVGLNSNKRIGGFSRGMKQRLGVAQALIGKPKLLICDEPTSALDPIGRRDLLDTLQSIKGETAVLFSTHILTDVERIADKVVLLDDGVIKYDGTMRQLHAKYTTSRLQIIFQSPKDLVAFIGSYKGSAVEVSDVELELPIKNLKHDYQDVLGAVTGAGIVPTHLMFAETSLEDVFMKVTK